MTREIALRDEVAFQTALPTYDHYLARSIEWAFSVIGWQIIHPDYVKKNPGSITVAWEALQRNIRWAEQTKEIEAHEAYQRFMRTGKLDGIDLAKIDRHEETAQLLWEEVERIHNSNRDNAGAFEPTMSVEDASGMLASTLFSLEMQGFVVNIAVADDEDNAWLTVSFPELKHHDRIIQRNGHGEWEDYPA